LAAIPRQMCWTKACASARRRPSGTDTESAAGGGAPALRTQASMTQHLGSMATEAAPALAFGASETPATVQEQLAPLLKLLELLGDEVAAASQQEFEFEERPSPRPPVPAQLTLALDFPALPPPSPRRAKGQPLSRAMLLARLLNPELTLRETALLLNVCPTTVRRYTNSGQLPHHRTQGNQRRFRLSDILEFVTKHGKT